MFTFKIISEGLTIVLYTFPLRSRDSVVGTATGYGQEFSLLHSVQTVGSGARPASYPMGTGDSFPGDKATGA
jgi:hypothetical protein